MTKPITHNLFSSSKNTLTYNNVEFKKGPGVKLGGGVEAAG